MNMARILIDAIVWLTPVAVVASPIASDQMRLVLAVFLFCSILSFTLVGVARFYRRPRDTSESRCHNA
jgi:hypothetical protein